ncbi:serine hydrolase domain-containing protein [Leifsonia shinshuensis]|uniref:Beta-lactamase family protein n=1 Tax=Leifsonia shinshuensis TaxID=150026 RepID=A0A7G6YBF6_9MICO|nr:serine hydrolase domain-containing protein [Leifsonia shinshuensis]QNE35821.1 beta-lactamase family protein [Leifsonia shinshuensis]
MSVIATYADRLLQLGGAGAHPAGGIVGVRTGADVEVRTAGWAVLPGSGVAPVPMRRGQLIDLASVTKVAATTAMAMRLVADRRLDLSARVGSFLPAFAGGAKDDVSVYQLLTHTAGLRPWWPLYLETTDRDEAILRAQELPLASAPGTAWRYSDLGLLLAGAVVEEVTGETLRDAYRTLIADPLRLTSGYGPVPSETAATSADSDAYEFRMVVTGTPYPVPFTAGRFTGWRNTPVRGEANDGNAAHALGGASGHAGLFSTVDDLLTLGAALRGGEFVPEDVLARFSEPNPIRPDQAVGFRRSTLDVAGDRVTLLGHGGFTGTWFGFGLDHDVVVAGGAMRLCGTVGAIPDDGTSPQLPELVTVDAIQRVLLDAAAATLHGRHSFTTTQAEER